MLVSEEWLERINRELSERRVPHHLRPWDAIEKLSFERKEGVIFPSPVASQIFEWFESHSPKGSHLLGVQFTAAYYFDAYFWKVSIPIAYGTVQMDAFDSIDMPMPIKAALKSTKSQMYSYTSLWTDAMDYGYGRNDVGLSKAVSPSAMGFFQSGDRDLKATVTLLTEGARPNPKAIESSRMCTELFLKAYLSAHAAKSDEDLKTKFGHNLRKLVEECMAYEVEFFGIRELVGVFPDVNARYSGVPYSDEVLWNAYCVAQLVATIFVRSLSDRDSRGQMFGAKLAKRIREAKASFKAGTFRQS